MGTLDNGGRVSNNYAVIPGRHGDWRWDLVSASMTEVLKLNESNNKEYAKDNKNI